jgi:hypothetical protein
MSNKSRLQTNNENLQSLIDKANQLPDAGGGGGGIETCTVIISFTYGDPTDVWISGTQLIDGNISPFTFIDYGDEPESFSSPLTISNIVKNTLLIISGYGSYVIDRGVGSLVGCEVAYSAITCGTFAVKITDTIASVTVTNIY